MSGTGLPGVPCWPKRTDSEKRQWKEKLEEMKGKSFSYSVNGFDTSRYTSDAATITIQVEEDGAIQCTDPACVAEKRHQFGRKAATRGEFNAHKHVISYHRPSRKTVAGESSSHPEKKQQRAISMFGFTVRPSKTKGSVASNEVGVSSSSTKNDCPGGGGGDGDSSPNTVGGRKRCSYDGNASDVSTEIESPYPTRNGRSGTVKIPKQNKDDSPSSSLPSLSSSDEMGEGCDADVIDARAAEAASSASWACPVPPWAYKFAADAGAKPGMSILRCSGADITLPSPAYLNYPVAIQQVVPDISRKFVFDNVLGNVVSASCHPYCILKAPNDDSVASNAAAPYRCSSCLSLSNDPLLRGIVKRAHDDKLHLSTINNAYLTNRQKDQRLKHHVSQNNSLKLEALNSNRSLEIVCGRRDEQKRLIAAVAEGNIPRCQQILVEAARQGKSVEATLQMMTKARNGTYHPKGYTSRELDEAILVWKLGGASLLYAENHSFNKGGPSLRCIQRRANIPTYVPMYSDVLESTVKLNCERFLFDTSRHSPSDKTRCLRVMMIDDVKAEPRARYCSRSGKVLGLCGCAAKNHISTNINSAEDCEAIAQALNNGDAHLATEITNVAIGPIRMKDYQPVFIATSAGCLSKDPPERLEQLVRASVAAYVSDPRGEATLGRLSTIQPDGAGAFVSLSQRLFFSDIMTDHHPLYRHLSVLPLFNMHTGSGIYERLTAGCEQKHGWKRTKERIKGEVGFMMLDFKFTGSFLQDLLLHVTTKTFREEDVKTMFNVGYADAMNVPAMVKLYRAIADIAELEPTEFGQRQAAVEAVRDELRLLGKFCGAVWTMLCDKTPSLGAQLANVSFLAHIVFVCYRRNGTKFLPSQNYNNLQRYFRSVFWSMANAIEDGIPTYFLFQDSGDRLEEAYGLLRCLCGGASGTGSGMDVLQATERISGVMAVQGVYARNPELQKGSRHLKASEDHQNPSSFLSDDNGGQDYRRINVEGMSLQHKYIFGRSAAKKDLIDAGFSEEHVDWNKISKEKDVDLLRPKGKFVGIADKDDESEKPCGA